MHAVIIVVSAIAVSVLMFCGMISCFFNVCGGVVDMFADLRFVYVSSYLKSRFSHPISFVSYKVVFFVLFSSCFFPVCFADVWEECVSCWVLVYVCYF